jgi:lysophospholipase L1-like esterase
VVGDSLFEGQGQDSLSARAIARIGRALHRRLGVAGASPPDVTSIPMVNASPTLSALTPWSGGLSADLTYGWGSRGVTLSGTPTITVTADKVTLIAAATTAAGSYTYTVDGGAPVTVTTGGQAANLDGGIRTTVTLGAVGGSHTIALASASGTVHFDAILVFNGDQASGLHIIDSSHSGFQSVSTTFTNYGHLAQAVPPDLVVIEFWSNDQTSNVTAATFQSNIQTLISTIKAGCTTAGAHSPSFLLVAVANNSNDTGATVKRSAYIAAMQAVAAADPSNVVFFDLAGRVPAANASDNLGLYYDGIHWNNAGAAFVADALADIIAPAFDPPAAIGSGGGGNVTGTGITSIVKLTQAAYDALGTKDAATLYVIVG